MASRKNLKKTVNYIINTATGFCLIEASQAPTEKREGYSKVFEKIDRLQTNIINRISHTEPGNVKLYYKKLKEDFNKEIGEIFSELSELGK